MKPRLLSWIGALLTFALVCSATAQARPTVFVTSDNLNGTNLFGTLDLRTGKFTQIAQTTPLFYGLTVGSDGHLFGADLNTGTLFKLTKSGATLPYGSITAPGLQYPSYGFFGLAWREQQDDFLAVNVDPMHVTLYEVSRRGSKLRDIGVIEGPNTGIFFSGSLVFGPHSRLYFEFLPILADGSVGNAQLFTVNEKTGAPTPVGKGMGTDFLTLVSDGDTLYGIDGDTTTGIGIYVIDTRTGVARPTGVTVSGLPDTNDFYIDTAAYDPHDHDRCR